jgi:hypothetical protein
MCREGIDEVLKFSERILPSFVEVRVTDNLRDRLPSAALSSSQTLQNVSRELKNMCESMVGYTASLVTIRLTICISALPDTADYFERFERCLLINESSMQRAYDQLRGLVQPLEHPSRRVA